MVYNQERFQIKSGLWWRAYGSSKTFWPPSRFWAIFKNFGKKWRVATVKKASWAQLCQINCLVHLTEKRRLSNIKQNDQKITLKISESSPKFTLEILEYRKRIENLEMYWNAFITYIDLNHFCEVFLTIAVAQLHFLFFFSSRGASYFTELRTKDHWRTSSGTVLLFS